MKLTYLRAVIIIQTAWRGYRARKQVKLMKRAASSLQKILRTNIKVKTQKREEEYQRIKKEEREEKEKLSLRLKRKELEYQMVAQLNPTVAKTLFSHQKHTAAEKIQAIWKGWKSRAEYKDLLIEKKLNQAACIIQNSWKKSKERERYKLELENAKKERILRLPPDETEFRVIQKKLIQRKLARAENNNLSENNNIINAEQLWLNFSRQRAQRIVHSSELKSVQQTTNQMIDCLLAVTDLTSLSKKITEYSNAPAPHTERYQIAVTNHHQDLEKSGLPFWKTLKDLPPPI